MSIRFSIIIPVYNVEKYLDKCLESILSQEFGNFEIICVDDCSTDNSWNMLEKYAEKDKRIRIFQQEKNAGQGVARNRALDLAQGEYILFVDPDDWIEKNSLTVLDEELKKTKAQVLLFGVYGYDEMNTGKIEKRKELLRLISEFVLNKEEKSFTWKSLKIDVLVLFGAVWDRCYSREFICKNNIRFFSTRIGEDNIFSQNSILSAEKIFFTNYFLYYYRLRKKSAVNVLSDENFCVFDNIKQTEKLIYSKGLEKELKKALEKYKIQSLKDSFLRLPLKSQPLFKTQARKLLSSKGYKKFLKGLEPSFLEKIFSIRNKRIDGTKYKVICIFGLEFVLPNKKKKQRRDR